jgi:hypothetical protein
MKYLTQNSKMKKSSTNNAVVYNFGIPAYKSRRYGIRTCPSAKECARGCYALSGPYQF